MKVKVDTTEYELAYGERPQGMGTGSWEFRIGTAFRQFSGTFEQARSAAKSWAKRHRIRLVVVVA